MTGPITAPFRTAVHWLPPLVCILLFVGLATRVMSVQAPWLELSSGESLALHFSDGRCRPGALLADSDYSDKWSSHRAMPRQQLRCVSDPVKFGKQQHLLVRYAGNPADRGIRIGLDLDQDGAIDSPLMLGAAAHRGWLVSVASLPPGAADKVARLVVEDYSDRNDGWVVVRDLVQFDGNWRGLDGVQPWSPMLAASCAMLLVAWLIWHPGQRRPVLLAACMSGLLAIEFLQLSSFYQMDEYVLMSTYPDGITWRDLTSYYDQFSPLFLTAFAAAAAVAGSWYAPLQVAMLIGHVGVCMLVLRILRMHGCSNRMALCIALLFGTAWVHLDVVPWFIEGCFLTSTALILLGIERTAAYVDGSRHALRWAVGATALAPLTFAGGVVAPWLCFAYILLFRAEDRKALALFLFVALASVGLVLLGSTALDTAQSVAATTPVSRMVAFLLTGILASSLASLLAVRDAPWTAVLGLAGAAVVIFLASGARARTTRSMKIMLFGALWMIAGYALQAVVRTNTGYGDAMSYRYTYFGMTGVAFAVGALLRPLGTRWQSSREPIRRGIAVIGMIATVAGVGRNTYEFLVQSNGNEREYFDISRQYFAMTRSALIWAESRGEPAPPGLVPKTIFPGNQAATPAELTRQYREVVCYLASCKPPPHSYLNPIEDARTEAVWDRLLYP